ncbi:MAG: biotin/lipoyl-containing protein [Elusimicrobiota bacterium]
MNKRTLQDVADWMKTTDLARVSYRRAGETIEFSLEDAPSAAESAFPPCRLIPVSAREVGLFRPGPLGTAGGIEKGSEVKEGAVLGLIAAGKEQHEVKAPAAGRIISALVEDGDPVEYGQPLFFIQP